MRLTDTTGGVLARRRCPACGAGEPRRLYSRRFDDPRMRAYMEAAYYGYVEHAYIADAEFALDECQRCGLIFQRYVPDQALAKRLYDVWIDPDLARQWHREVRGDHPSSKSGCSILLSMEHLLPALDDRRLTLLDYGAGFGDLSALARGFGFDVTALELSDDRAAALRGLGIRVIPSLDGFTGAFDAVILNQVLEHLAEPFGCILAIRRAMRAGGILYVGVPDCRHLRRTAAGFDRLTTTRLQQAMVPCSPLQHVNSFTRRSLEALLNRAGLEIAGEPGLSVGHAIGARELAKQTLRPWYHWARLRLAPSTFVLAVAVAARES